MVGTPDSLGPKVPWALEARKGIEDGAKYYGWPETAIWSSDNPSGNRSRRRFEPAGYPYLSRKREEMVILFRKPGASARNPEHYHVLR